MKKKTNKRAGKKTTFKGEACSTTATVGDSGRSGCRMTVILVPLAIILVTLGLFMYLPVMVTIYSAPQDDSLTPLGEILPGNPLEQCTSNISVFTPYHEVNIDIMLATYNRVNTSNYSFQVFVQQDGIKTVLAEELVPANSVEDNAYRHFEVEVPPTTPGKLCIGLSTTDAKPGNAITVWLNGKLDPVMKISAYGKPSMLFGQLADLNDFSLGRDTLLGLFFVYLLVQVWLVFYLYAKQKTTDNPDNRRTG